MLSRTTNTGGSTEAARCRKHGSWAWFWLCTILPAHSSLLHTWLICFICFEEVGVWGGDHVTVLFGGFSDGIRHFLRQTGNSVSSVYTVWASPSVRVGKTLRETFHNSPYLASSLSYGQVCFDWAGAWCTSDDIYSCVSQLSTSTECQSVSFFFLEGIINGLFDCM